MSKFCGMDLFSTISILSVHLTFHWIDNAFNFNGMTWLYAFTAFQCSLFHKEYIRWRHLCHSNSRVLSSKFGNAISMLIPSDISEVKFSFDGNFFGFLWLFQNIFLILTFPEHISISLQILNIFRRNSIFVKAQFFAKFQFSYKFPLHIRSKNIP